jgi:DNA-binding IclR family transcriptional regulator
LSSKKEGARDAVTCQTSEGEAEAESKMSSDTTPLKMLRVLDLIEASDRPLTAEVLLKTLGLTRSTFYRYLKILTETGFITSMPDAGFTLGPRIAELDYRMRQTDPLIKASRPVMVELARSERCVVLLCRRYKDRVLCIDQERTDRSLPSHYTRGLARSLYRGAASRIILAFLSTSTISRLYGASPAEFAVAGLGDSLADVRTSLRQIRHRGWEITHGQLTSGVTGVAAPIFDPNGDILGSFSITLPVPEMAETEELRLADRIKFCAQIIGNSISQDWSFDKDDV